MKKYLVATAVAIVLGGSLVYANNNNQAETDCCEEQKECCITGQDCCETQEDCCEAQEACCK
ncbi:MAG: hypothetical protein CSA38_03245 [Flavobacteriales bacterium]|nr:MAG: hypothetical protein CSA38_03245 [Flavobacteriales bacterium]